jgi:hypothetical protein
LGDYSPPAAAGGGALVLIASSVLAADAASIDFTNIPATYNHLRLVIVARATGATEDDFFIVRLNNDGAANYDRILSVSENNAMAIATANATAAPFGAYVPAASATAGVAGYAEVTIPLYAGTTWQKVIHTVGGYVDTAAANNRSGFATANWRSTVAVNRVTLLPSAGPNFKAGSAAYLYGLT